MLPSHIHQARALEAERSRRLRERRRPAEPARRRLPRRSARRAIGRSLVRIGHRLAAEPSNDPVRAL